MSRRITDLSSLSRGGGAGRPANETQQRPLTARGTVAIAPTSETSPMEVAIDTVTSDYSVTIPAGNWAPRGTTLPDVGDACLVVFDNVGDAWVPMFNPF